jgi:hypothetical protein
MGLFPNDFMDYSKKSIDHLIQNKANYYIPTPVISEGEGK